MLEKKIVEKTDLTLFTEKQREVLDLLLDHKTSKEIARELEISPHTVDQRIDFAKRKLGAKSRSEVAVTYRRLRAIYEPLTREEFPIAYSAISQDEESTNDAAEMIGLAHPKRTEPLGTTPQVTDYRVVPEMFDGRYGALMRITAIAILAVLLVLLMLGGLTMFGQLSEQFAA